MKKKLSKILPVLIMLMGLSLIFYPTVSDWWNSFHQTQAIVNYAEKVETMSPEERQAYLEEAWQYNQELYTKGQMAALSSEGEALYNSVLDWDDGGMMGYIEIPSINCYYPIYHGTSDVVLQKAIGHLNWTSLPVGGENSHSVLSGHRGLPSAKLFTDLIDLEEGDTFRIVILSESFTYEVDQVLVIEPTELDHLRIVEGEDYCTLLTCTPYGINTHRLLVQGRQIESREEVMPIQEKVADDNRRLLIVACVIALLAIVAVVLLLMRRRRQQALQESVVEEWNVEQNERHKIE